MSSVTKPCPFCGEAILATAQKCRYCRSYLDPLVRRQAASTSAADRLMLPVGRPASAIAAGYLGLFSFFPLVGAVAGIAAVLCGVSALKKIRNDSSLHGRGRAWFGIVVGAPLAVVWTVGIVALVIVALAKPPH